MEKIIKYIFIGMLGLTLIGCEEYNPFKKNEFGGYTKSTSEKEASARFESATESQKNCVNSFSQEEYKDKSLTWKLDNCYVPR